MSSTVSFSGKRVATMRARRSSRSDSGVSIVNGRIAVASADFSAMTDIWVLLVWVVVWDRTNLIALPARRARRRPWFCYVGCPPGVSLGSLHRRAVAARVPVPGENAGDAASRPALPRGGDRLGRSAAAGCFRSGSNQVRVGARQCVSQLSAGADVELGEDVAQMPL